MLHYATRLVSTTASTTPFSSILRAAAGRAWKSRAHTNNVCQPVSTKLDMARSRADRPTGTSYSPPPCNENELTVLSEGKLPVSAYPVDPNTLSENAINWTETRRIEFMDPFDPRSDSAFLINPTPPQEFPAFHLPVPTSPQSLYKNLLCITAHPHSVSNLIHYHFHGPRTLRSTRSYNLLIDLTIQHAAFGTALRLLWSMHEEAIPANMETWKLTVRWLVRTGRWDEAWIRVSSIARRLAHDQGDVTKHGRTHTIPLPLWLELFGSQKRGALRHCKTFETKTAPRNQRSNLYGSKRTVLQPCPSHVPPALALRRYRLLMKVQPSLTPSEIHPRAVLILARTLIEAGHRDYAFTMTSAYLKNLPSRTRRYHHRAVLNLIHLHLNALPAKRGLSRHFAQRRLLFELLDTHANVRPSAMTLFLLLGSLRACRHCGTLALQCLRKFRSRWGPRTESSMVRRRVANLALKEGRFDIVGNMLQAEEMVCRIKRGWRLQVQVHGYPFPRPSKLLRWNRLKGVGVENWRWSLLKKKFLRMKEKQALS
ncbi:hypothetical protein ID866_5044 [Astraeus odoratus]|nr:hypothetical protein ID866_5044 [Astraeus odoratus]